MKFGISRTFHNLDPGTNYDIRVFSCLNQQGNQNQIEHCSSAIQVSGQTSASGPPSKPLNFTATRGAGDEYTLDWNPPSTFPDTVTGYQVRYRERGTGPWTAFNNLITTVPRTTTSPAFSGKAWDFQVAAVNAQGTGPYSDTAILAGPPGAPGNFRVTDVSNQNQDVLAWNVPSDNGGGQITGYKLERRQIGETAWETAVDKGATQRTHNYGKASWSVGYDYRVRAVNSAGEGANSNVIKVGGRPTLKSGAAGTPAATPATDRVAVTLDWSGTLDQNGGKAISEWRYRYKLSSGSAWTTVSDIAPGTTSVTVEGPPLNPGTDYDFDVIACNEDRCSFTSTDVTATTLNVAASISSPASLTEAGLDGATLTVDLVGTEYVSSLSPGHFGLNPGPAGTSISSVERVGDTRAELTLGFTGDFSADTVIAVTVSAFGHTGSGQLSTPTKPVTAETAPAVVVATSADGGAGTVTVNWNAVAGANGYKVQWKGPGENYDAGNRQIVITDRDTTTATIPGLPPSTTYTVRVIATKRLAPDGPPSLELTATTAAISAVISSPSSLTERGLDGARLTVDLVGAQYASSLVPGDFGLLPQGIGGLSVDSVDRRSNTRAVLTLAFTGNIAANFGLQVTVDGSAHTSSGTLTTAAVTVTQAPRPGQVAGVRATGGPASLTVTWRAASNADAYQVSVWRADDRSDSTTRRVEGGSTTRTSIGGLLGDTGYSLRVVALSNFASSGVFSDIVTATTLPGHAIVSATDPSPLTEDSLDGATLTVDLLGALYDPWAPRLDRATVTASGVPGVTVADVTRVSDRRMAVTLAYDDTDFDDDKTLRVDFHLAHTSIGTISAVTPVKAVVEAPPAQVKNVRATAGTQRVRVQWDGVPTAYENLDLNVYRVQWKGPGESWRERRVRGSQTALAIGANPGTEVTVRVVATRHKAPDGPPSAEARAATPGFSYRVKATQPAQLTGVNLNGATVTVALKGAEWRHYGPRHLFRLSGLDTGVRVERVERVSPAEARIVLAHRGPSITEDGTLTITIDEDTHSWKGDLTVTVPVKAPGEASGVRVTEMTDTTVTVAWDRFEGVNVYYQVRWKESAASGGWRGRWMRGWSRPGSMPSYRIRDLTPGTEYTVQVRYYDRGGVGFGRWTTATMTPGETETPDGGLDTAQNQTAGVTVAADDPVPVAEGGSASYTVVLDGQPAGDVTIAMTSDNPDVTTQPASLAFTPDNWQTAQTVTVSAAHDDDAADEAATVSHSVSGADGYAGIAVASVAVAVTDDDTAGVTVSESTLNLEEGGSSTYTVVLDTRPAGDVRIHPDAHGGGLTAAPSELTFTPQNWNQAQTVTVSAAHDDDKLDGQGYVTHGILVPAGSAYDGIAMPAIVVSVVDDDLEAQAAQEAPVEASTDATLSGLAVSQGRLSAAFHAATTAYEAIVPEAVASITVTPTAAHAGATVTVNGVAVESGSPSGPVAATEGSVVTVRVTAEDGVTTKDYVIALVPPPAWTLTLVREDRPFTVVAELEADAEYPSTFLRLERGTSTAPIPSWLPVTVGGTAANPADYEFNQGNQFRGITRKSDDLMRGARRITVKGDALDEGAETV